MEKKFEYDSTPITFIFGMAGSWLFSAMFFYFYSDDYQISLGGILMPPWVYLVFAVCLIPCGFCFLYILRIRKNFPHHIGVSDLGIEIPRNRLSKRHIFISFSEIQSLNLREFYAGVHHLNIYSNGKRYQVSENAFHRSAHFNEFIKSIKTKCSEQTHLSF